MRRFLAEDKSFPPIYKPGREIAKRAQPEGLGPYLRPALSVKDIAYISLEMLRMPPYMRGFEAPMKRPSTILRPIGQAFPELELFLYTEFSTGQRSDL